MELEIKERGEREKRILDTKIYLQDIPSSYTISVSKEWPNIFLFLNLGDSSGKRLGETFNRGKSIEFEPGQR